MKKVNIETQKIKDARRKSKGFIEEFLTFIKRGNVVDLAVGVIIGAAFGSIVSSLVDDILMPLLGVIIGGLDFSSLSITVKDATIKYGMFIQNVIDFLIVAFCVFIFVKLINKFLEKTKQEEKKEEVTKAQDILLLEEIRDLIKKK